LLLCLTKIDDLPDVMMGLRSLADQQGWEFVYKNAPTLDELANILHRVTVIYMNPNKSQIIFTKEVLERFKNLEIICTASTGTIHIDLDAATNLDIRVISIKRHIEILKKIPSTAELAFTLTMDGLRHVTRSHNDAINLGVWDFENYIGRQIKDLKVGVLGYGRLGKIYSKMFKDSGAQLRILDPILSFDFNADLSEFIATSRDLDVLAIHMHAEGNEQFVDDRFFEKLSDEVVVVNTSRGEVVNHSDLLKFLDRVPTSVYCTDVLPFEGSPKLRDELIREFAKRPNVIITQHIGGMTYGARRMAFKLACDLLMDAYGVSYE
jgi:D-3-phosphoglycerate dehydrogenase / 2-oxoglutarate reductase